MGLFPWLGAPDGALDPRDRGSAHVDDALLRVVGTTEAADLLREPPALHARSAASGAEGRKTRTEDEPPLSGSRAPDPLGTAPQTAEGDFDEEWVDSDLGTGEILILFTDPGVPDSAQGSPDAAAEALRAQADAQWRLIEDELSDLQRRGTLTVLNRFWVTNAVLVRAQLDSPTLATLAALPHAREVVPNYTVEGLAEDAPTAAETPTVPTTASLVTGVPVTYGVEKIRANQVWGDFGVRGRGVRVAVLDTGVDATHPDIRDRLVGRGTGDPSYPGGWINFDRLGRPVVSKPSDPGSHGTHVAGTIVGGASSGTQIGVAPEAELMAANVLSGGGSSAKILAALEWVMAPYDGTGTPAGRAADVINMSLGSGAYDATLITPLQNLRQAGIFPAIAIGNAPCGPNGTSSPGDIYEAFGVGMTDAEDQVAAGSCGAVTNWPSAIADAHGWPSNFVKPDASAPGVKVFSAMPGGTWGEATGTSMATPHVAGAVALLRSAQAGLSVDQLADALETTAWYPEGGIAPDSRYGHGRIDVHAAVTAMLGQSGVIGTVIDAETHAPVAGAEVSYGPRGETWITDADGRFTARLVPGSYTFTVERFGFASATSQPILVTTDTYGNTQIALSPIKTGTISGVVVAHDPADDAEPRGGAPIAGAEVRVLGEDLTTRTAADGSYRFEGLPIGEYRIRVIATGMQESTSEPAPVQAALETTVNFRLAQKQRVLVLGDNGGRTSAFLTENGLLATSADTLPDPVSAIAEYAAIVWDTPTSLTAEQLGRAREAAALQDTGMVWLDQGSSEDSGVAQLHRLTGEPTTRGAGNDRSLTATGYRISGTHQILAGGALSPDPIDGLLRQITTSGGPKFTAWFDGLSGERVTILADAVGIRGEGAETQIESLGAGIAVDDRDGGRQVYLSLHGSSAASDAQSWSAASKQLFYNSVTWAAPAAMQAPDPQIIVPTAPPIPTGPGTGPTPGSAAPAPSAARAAKAPAAQSTPKPEHTPNAPVASINMLTSANAGGVTVEVIDGIAHVRIPDAKPGDWFFLHVYPQKLAVGWIRVNDEGALRIDISRLGGGEYRFAFTSSADEFVGWAAVKIAGTALTAAPDPDADLTSDQSAGSGNAGFTLSSAEQFMLLGAALIILAAAGVVLLGLRQPNREKETSASDEDARPTP